MKKRIAGIAALALCLLFSGCVKLTEVALPGLIEMEKGETAAAQLTADYSKKDPTDEETAKALAALRWTSSDEAVVRVENGTLTALAPGSAQITVHDESGKISATAQVQVSVPIESLAAQALELQLDGIESAPLNVTISPADATQTEFTYKVSDEKVAAVDKNGTVSAKALGECEITVVGENNKTATAKVTVTQKATGIALDNTAGWIYVGGSVQLNPSTVPVEADASTYTYKSDNNKIAAVSENGVITGKAAGTAKITVTSAEDFAATYSITVKVRPVAPKKPPTGAPKGNTGGGTAGGAAGGGAAVGGGGGGGEAPAPAPAPEPAPAPAPPPAPVPDNPNHGTSPDVTPGENGNATNGGD